MALTRRFTISVATIACSLAMATAAAAQQSAAQQACINIINKDAAKVGKAQGKENSSCVKKGTKDSVATNCPTADLKMKVSSKVARAGADDMSICTIEMPSFAYTSGANAADAYKQAELDLLVDMFGNTNLDMPISSDKVIGHCQLKVSKDTEKIAAAAAKAFNKCKNDAIKGPAAAATDVQNCVGDDSKGKVAAGITKLGADITKKCSTVTVSMAFPAPGKCASATLGTLADCMGSRAKCRMCLAANDADNVSANCDLIDDALANASCP